MPQIDILIAGGGIIGLTLALELHSRGAQVTVLERDTAMEQASTAAAGMLAAKDPHNPIEISELAEYSLELYPELLERLTSMGSLGVPYQTETTLQYDAQGHRTSIPEHSIDPRQLAVALIAAVRSTSIRLCENVGALELADTADAELLPSDGE